MLTQNVFSKKRGLNYRVIRRVKELSDTHTRFEIEIFMGYVEEEKEDQLMCSFVNTKDNKKL